MRSRDLLLYAYGQIQETLRAAVEGLDPDQLTARVGPEANTIAWLAWHLARVQDDHIAEVAECEQVWLGQAGPRRFGLPFEVEATGYAFNSEQVAQVRVPSADLLIDYAGAVHDQTMDYL